MFTIFHRNNAVAEIYHQPRWWTQSFGWVSFTPTLPHYTGPLLSRLARVPTDLDMYSENGRELGYMIPESMQESWSRLESYLAYATALITKEYTLAAVRPFSPWALGYLKGRYSRSRAVALAVQSRNWFSLWMGLASYLIAEAESLSEQGAIRTWPELLLSHNFEQTWIDALRSSTICDFSSAPLRAGVFITLRATKTSEPRPAVDWFCERNVPVWYRWGSDEIRDPSCSDFAPPYNVLQEVATYLCPELSTPRLLHAEPINTVSSQSSEPTLSRDEPVEQVDAPRQREYIAWFANRAERKKAHLLTETAKDRQTRLNRERCPPTVSAKVFVWEPSFAEPTKWVRVPVYRDAREETLGEYGAAQCRYDSFYNEWDCCEEFGPADNEDDGANYLYLDGQNELDVDASDELDDWSQSPDPPHMTFSGPRALTPPLQPAQILDAEPIDLPQSHPIRIDALFKQQPTPLSEAEAWEQEVLEILFLHYGYTPPLPMPSTFPAPLSEADRKKLIRLLGLSWKECKGHVSTLSVAGFVKTYMDGLVTGACPSDDKCDFNAHSRVSLMSSRRLKFLRIVNIADEKGRPLYMFDFRHGSKAPWKLTLTTAADALMVCRLDPQLSEYELARYLLARGIPFHTLLLSELAPRVPREPPPPCVLPVRSPDSVFSRKDYDAYVKQRSSIIGQPRARAALLQGGFIWRICVSTISFDSVIQGPTGWNPIPGTMFTARDPRTNEIFIDDKLTDVELNLIAGTYMCYTGLGTQLAARSWYPLVSTFEAGGEDYGRWNVYREDGFLMRLDEINNPGRPEGSRGPLTAKKWRDLMRGMKEMRLLKDNIQRLSTPSSRNISKHKNTILDIYIMYIHILRNE
ncbi:hypothetical protein FPV67DRAFT_1680475 [Lyophyllum atratum]|nr:hypothetical protein FPV67DRAFT_1680475 [Lyophyllum atratum]